MKNKYNILKELAKDKSKSQNAILKEFRAKGHKIGNAKGREIIREVRGSKETITKERDEYIEELLKDHLVEEPLNFRQLGKKLREAGYSIGNAALLEKYREIRLERKVSQLWKSVEKEIMQEETAQRVSDEMREYFAKGQINNLNNLYARLFDIENNPIFLPH